MKQLLKFFLPIIALIAIIDVAVGWGSRRYMRLSTLPGDYRSIDYVMRESQDDVLILGSSVALNSLMPTMLEDSLGMTCFNGAANAQQLPFYLSMLDCVLQRHEPRLVIVGLTTDACATTGLGDRYNVLAPYYHMGYRYIDSCMEAKSAIERFKLKSNLLRYNTIWFRILLYHFITADNPGVKGFVAKDVPAIQPTMIDVAEGAPMIDERRDQLMQMVEMCRSHGVDLVVFFPPQYQRLVGADSCRDGVSALCTAHDVRCFDFSQDILFLNHPEWFYDNIHLNANGAPIFTSMFIDSIKASVDSVPTPRFNHEN